MDLFTVASTKALVSNLFAKKNDIPTKAFCILEFGSDGNGGYKWADSKPNYANYSYGVPVYTSANPYYYLFPVYSDMDEYAHYQYIDTTTDTLHYLVFKFDISGITLVSETTYTFTPNP